MADFTDDAEKDWDRLKGDNRDYFDDVNQNTEKSRVKQTSEQTKLRDKLKAIWQPALERLKREQVDEKVRLDKITASAERAARATNKAFGGDNRQGLVKSEEAIAKARGHASLMAAKLEEVERRLTTARERQQKALAELQSAEAALERVRQLGEIDTDQVASAERRLEEARRNNADDTDQISRLETELARARERAEQSARRTAEVEDQVAAARGNAERTSGRVAEAEERVARVRDRVAAAAKNVEDAEHGVSRAHDDSARSADRVADSHRRLGDRFRDAGERGGFFGGIMRGLGGVMDGLSGASRIASSVMGNLEESLAGAVGGGKDLLQTLLQLGAQMALFITIGEAVSYVVGAIGAAIVGLPALIGAAAASFAVFKLGMQGIKNAYNAELKPALDALGKQISTVFEQGLKPVFHELATQLIPQITDQLKGLAQGWVDVAGDIQRVITNAEGIRNIQGIIDKTTEAVRNLGPPLAGLVEGFLRLANTGTILQNMVGIIQDLISNVTNFFNEMQRTGDAERAVAALRGALDAAEKAILNVLHSAINFFTQATPGFDHLVTSVGNIASALLDRLGPAFGTAMDAAGTFLDRIPPSSLDGIRDAVQHVADAFQRFADSGAPQLIADGVSALTDAFADAVDIVSSVVDAYNSVRLAIAGVDDALGIATSAEEDMLRASGQAAGGANHLADELAGIPPPAQAIPPPVDAAAGSLGRFGDQAQGLPGQVAPPMDATRTAIEDSMRRAQDAARTGGQGVHDGVTGPLPSMQQTTQVSFDTLPPVVRDAMVGAEAAARTGSDLVKTAVTDGFNNAAQAATDAMNRLRDAVQTGFTTISTSVQGAMTGVSTQIIGTFQNIASVVQANVQQIVQSAQQMAQGVQQAATQMSGAMGQASSQVQGFLRAISSAFQSNMQLAQQATQQSMQQIQQTIQRAMQQVVQSVQQSMQQLVQAVQQGGQQAVQSAQQTAQQIVQAFTSQEGAMEAAGRALIERLTAGMIAAGAQATAAAARIAASIRAQFPSSPAKEGPLSGSGDPQLSGGKIVTRLADGMIGQLSAITAAAARAAQAVQSAFDRRPYNPRTDRPIGTRYEDGTVEDGRPKLTHAAVQRIIAGMRGGFTSATLAEDGTYVNQRFYDNVSPEYAASRRGGFTSADPQQMAQAMASALQGMKLQFAPGTQGAMAQFVNQGNTQLARR